MLSVDDFSWTCLSINYPLVSFKFKYHKIMEGGVPLITINMIANLDTGKYQAYVATIKIDISKQEKKQLCDELFDQIEGIIEGVR